MAERVTTSAPIKIRQSTGVHKFYVLTRAYKKAVIATTDTLPGYWAAQNLNQVFKVSLANVSAGTFTLTFNGQTTAGIAYNADSYTVATALAALTTIGSALNIGVAGPPGGPYQITLKGTLAAAAYASSALTADGSSLTAANEVQIITEVGTANPVSGGTFTVSFNGQTTAAQAYNVSSGNLQTAIRGLSSVGTGNANVAGNAGGPYTVTFVSALAGAKQNLMTVNGSSLTPSGSGAYVTESVAGGAVAVTVSVLQTGSSNGNTTNPLLTTYNNDPARISRTIPDTPTAAKSQGAFQETRTGTVTVPTDPSSSEPQTRKYAMAMGARDNTLFSFASVKKVASTVWSTQQQVGFHP